ncbi:unnamed protein product [Gemmataceae bacterium]|nr:unnamed protein product [Gemmataceae bacterium]VTT97388.1 unnamed protein product [Gemmataceae bacterium]
MEWPYPVVRHMIVCRRPHPIDTAHREAILRIVFRLLPAASAAYPFRLPELHVFTQVAGGVGTFAFDIELFRMDAEPVMVGAAEPFDLTFDDRVAAYSFFRAFTLLPFERPGLYEFRLFARLLRNATGEPLHNQPRRLLAGEPLRMEAAT